MATATKRQSKRKSTAKPGMNKAEEIRKTATELGGKNVRPRDVIAALAEKGIAVTPPQVSQTLKAAGFRRMRRKKSTVPATNHNGFSGSAISLEHLLAAKALVERLGGADVAKKAIDVLAKLA